MRKKLELLAEKATFRVVMRGVIRSAPAKDVLEVVDFAKAQGFAPRILLLHDQAFTAIGDALDLVAEGKHPAFSWRRLITGHAPELSELRRFVNIQPILDYGALEPGGKATKVIRATIAELGLTPDRGVRVRLTGSVAFRTRNSPRGPTAPRSTAW